MKKLVRGEFVGNQDGSIMMSFALFLPVFILVMALSIDATQNYVVRSQVVAAQDAAALAASIVSDEQLAERGVTRTEYAEQFMNLNFNTSQEYLGTRVEVDFREADGEFIADSRTVSSNRVFAQASSAHGTELSAGRSTIVNTSSTVSSSIAPTLTVMVLDASSSMRKNKTTFEGDRIKRSTALVRVIRNYINTIYPEDGAIAVETQFISFWDTNRTEVLGDYADTRAAVTASINRYETHSGTCPGPGLERAFTSLQARIANPIYDGYKKQVIFMGDGGSKGGSCRPENACRKLKDAGVEVFGVAFGGSGAIGLAQACASSPENAVFASDGDALNEFFESIAGSVTAARISF